jgi:two-component system, cell cycle response regulator DivK
MEQASGRDVGAGRLRSSVAPQEGLRDRASTVRPVVLLVDDIEDCRDVYGQFLAHAGYRVVEAADGQEALAKAVSLRPDVIVMDLWMPHLDGWESIRRLKASPATADIPVLVLTGDAYAQARQEAVDAGCQAYLVKPCLPMDVAAQVGRLLADARGGAADGAQVRVLSERRGGLSRRRSESAGAVLATVLDDLEGRYHEIDAHLRALDTDARELPEAAAHLVQQRLTDMREPREALVRHLEALKVIVRSAEVRITIPARRAGPKRP